GSGLRKVTEDFDAIATDAALVENAGQESAHRARVVPPAVQRGEIGIGRTRLLRVSGLYRAAVGVGFQVERLASPDVDRSADTSFIEFSGRALVNLEQTDKLRRQQEVVEAAGGGQLLENEPVGDRYVMAIDCGVDQVRRHAAQRDAFTFPGFAIDDNARDPRHCFGEGLDGHLVDVLRRDIAYARVGL